MTNFLFSGILNFLGGIFNEDYMNQVKQSISRVEIEKLILECAKQHLNKRQFSTDIIRHYIETKISHEFLEQNKVLISEVLHSLIIASIFFPGEPMGLGSANSNLPHLTITSYGMQYIQEENFVPSDPDGYIEHLKKRIPNIDEIILYYSTESIHAFNQHLLVSATLTLGAASERLIDILSEAFIEAQNDVDKKRKLQGSFESKAIFKWHKEFTGEIFQIKENIPKNIRDNLDVYLEQFFHFIRMSRNEKGHPDKLQMSRNAVYGCLQIFVDYTEKIYALVNFLNKNKI